MISWNCFIGFLLLMQNSGRCLIVTVNYKSISHKWSFILGIFENN
ncbi:unnamed protein product [Brassica rapa subsp. trilocularis]